MSDSLRTPIAGTALVTGAAKRLGRAIALGMAGRGADIVVHYKRSADEANRLADEIRSLGRSAWIVQADLDNPHAAEGLFAKALAQAGPIDILINNASAFPADTLAETTPEAIGSSVNLHAVSPLLLARALAGQGRGGQVVNLLDCRIADYDRLHVSYHLGKRMLFDLTRMLAMELAPAVRVNAVAPGLILPPDGEDESYLDRLAHTNPLNRHGSKDDIVRAVIFLLESPFITGQVIYVDGGRHMKGNVYGG